MISQEQYDFLSREITKWEEADLLQSGQGRAILGSYQVHSRRAHCMTILSAVGACVSAAGMFIFIASNSGNIDPILKGVAVVLMMIASYVVAWRMKEKSPASYKTYGEALVLFGNLLFGAAASLIAQKFHLSGTGHLELLLWGFGIVPVTIIFQSRMSAVLSTGVLLTPVLSSSNYSSYEWVAALVVPVFVAYATRCPLALALPMMTVLWKVNCSSNAHPMSLILAGLGLFVLHILHKEHHRLSHMAMPFLMVGMITCLCGFFAGQFAYESTYSMPSSIPVEFLQCHAAFALLCMAFCFTSKKARNSGIVVTTGGVMLGLLLMNYLLDKSVTGITCHVMFVLASFGFVLYTGAKIDNRLVQAIPLCALIGEAIYLLTTVPGGGWMLAPGCFAAGAVMLIVCMVVTKRLENQNLRLRRSRETVLEQS